MLQHWIWLTTRRGIGTRGCAALLRLFGSAERIFEMKEAEYLSTEGFERRWLESLLDKSLDDAEKILVQCDEKRISLLTYCDEHYPDRLKNIADPPALLYYKGTLPEFDQEAAIAIVGSRRCSPYGLLHAKQFSKLIANSGGIVVSGGARGIDTMALRGALDSAMPVVCVLGCGLDVVYPAENHFLFRDIEMHGCMISELPPGTPPEARNFPPRNRIISGLSLGVLVVEAPEHSGALITADFALEQGRDVFSIPANIGVKSCAGSNRLLREGAIMVDSGWDVLQQYTYLFPDKLNDGRLAETARKIFQTRYHMALPVYSPMPMIGSDDKKSVDNPPVKNYSDEKEKSCAYTADETAVQSVMEAEPIHCDQIVAKCGLPVSRVMAALTMLQIKKRVEKLPGNYYQQKF